MYSTVDKCKRISKQAHALTRRHLKVLRWDAITRPRAVARNREIVVRSELELSSFAMSISLRNHNISPIVLSQLLAQFRMSQLDIVASNNLSDDAPSPHFLSLPQELLEQVVSYLTLLVSRYSSLVQHAKFYTRRQSSL